MNVLSFFLWNLSIILESLPISSSGHLRLIRKLLSEPLPTSYTEHLQHIPNAIIITLFLVFNCLIAHSCSLLTSLFIASLIANFITGTAYLFFKHLPQLPLSLGFFISGSVLLSLYYAPYGTLTELSITHALIIGLAQTLSLLPGISRMAMTVSSALWLGIEPKLGFMFSLLCELLLIIVAAVAALYKKDSSSTLWSLTHTQWSILMVSGTLSYGALQVALNGFVTGSIVYCGWYIIALSAYCRLSNVTY